MELGGRRARKPEGADGGGCRGQRPLTPVPQVGLLVGPWRLVVQIREVERPAVPSNVHALAGPSRLGRPANHRAPPLLQIHGNLTGRVVPGERVLEPWTDDRQGQTRVSDEAHAEMENVE